MKNLSKIGLLALVIATSFTACTKDNNAATPKKSNATLNKTNLSSINQYVKRKDTITPLRIIIPILRDTITPNFAPPRRDTITPNH